jgi:cation diffusion facilitator family transporter
MLLGAAATIAVQATQEILAPHHAPASYTLIVLLAVVAIKETMFRYQARIGQSIDSTAIRVDAWHQRSDAITSAAAAVGIAIALIGGKGYESADDWAALAACAVIVTNGVRFARTAVMELMDTTPRALLIDEIRATALRVDGAVYVEKLLVRKMGPRLYVDLHLEVGPTLSVLKAHGIAHAVKDAIMARHAEVADVLIHVEPARLPEANRSSHGRRDRKKSVDADHA